MFNNRYVLAALIVNPRELGEYALVPVIRWKRACGFPGGFDLAPD